MAHTYLQSHYIKDAQGDIRVLGFFTNLMMHGFWDKQIFSGTQNRATRGTYYSNVSIIRPGRSRPLEFEKKEIIFVVN